MPNDTPIDTTPVAVTSTSVSIHPLLGIPIDTNPVLGITQGSVIPPHILRVLLATAEELECSGNEGNILSPQALHILQASSFRSESSSRLDH